MSFFIRHFVGFFIQIFACVVLCFIPFSKEAFRISKKVAFLTCLLISAVTAVLFPSILEKMTQAMVLDTYSSANVYMLTVVAFFSVYYFVIIQEAPIKKFVVFSIVVFYAATQYWIVNVLMTVLLRIDAAEIYPVETLQLFFLTGIVLFPVFFYILHKLVREYLLEIDLKNMKREFKVILAVTGVYFFLMFFYASAPSVPWEWIAPLFAFLMVVFGILFATVFRESVRRKRSNEKLRQLEIQQIQYQKITQEMELTRRIHHDMRHNLRTIYNLAEQKKTEELKEYLPSVIEISAQRESEQFCQNIIVNNLLQHYIGWARSERIECTVRVDCCDLGIPMTDLTVLLGNLLENAIHSCLKIKEKRWIDVDIGLFGQSLVIQTRNACEDILFSKTKYVSGEFHHAEAFLSDSKEGGYGLKSVAITAEKYGGEARFQYSFEEKSFISRIRLNLYPDAL